MSAAVSSHVGVSGVRTVGGLIPADLLGRIVAGTDLPGLTADDYRLELGITPREAANRAWSVLTGAWAAYRDALDARPEGDRATTLTREKWLAVLLRELGFGRVPTTPAGGIQADDRSFPVSHQAGLLPIHLLGWKVDLDRKTPGVAGAAERPPHSMLQELLNRSDDHLWAILSNGSQLRLLRDSSSLVGQAFVEFDLESILDGGSFSDFVALYLICHQTRFESVSPDAGPEDCWLERWRADAVETGARALGDLRNGVKAALEVLGTGFLQHPANSELRTRLGPEGDLDPHAYHRALLRLVYRLLFCFVAEDRGLLLDPGASAAARSRYTDWFSTARLRRIATKRRGTRHADQWQSLSLVVDGLGSDEGRPELGLPGLGGIFRHSSADSVTGCQLTNDSLLAAIRHLCIIQPIEGGPRRTVDYRHLGAEELGGIYESLLELVPKVDAGVHVFSLEVLAGNERKTTGAHYTPTALIDVLLEWSLDVLLDEAEAKPDPEAALLALTVCDPAVGSGHFLVAAAKRIAHRLARARSGDAEPSQTDVHQALRDVIGRCVYGIDISPMAVELCKVSLWLEAMEPGKPLGFLDHHIVNGNGLIGVTPRLLDEGVPDAAFTAIEGDHKPTVTARRRTNSLQRSRRNQSLLGLSMDSAALVTPIAVEMASIEALPDDTPAQVQEKADRYETLEHAAVTERARVAADAWCAAFMVVKDADHVTINDDTVRTASENPGGLTPAQRAEIEQLREQYQFLHWHLAFPQVFTVDLDRGGETGCTSGFDLIAGNPPWDTLSPDAKEFFAKYEPQIRFENRDGQLAIIEHLTENQAVADAWSEHRRELFGLVHFLKNSGRYRMYAPGNLGKGDFNIYRMFVETALSMISESGWAAQVTPAGLFNGANASAIRRELFERYQLVLIAGLVNTGGHWFPGAHSMMGFALYSARRGSATDTFSSGFGIADETGLARLRSDPIRIEVATVRLQSPDALAISETKPGPDAEIAATLYGAWPAFGAETSGHPRRRYAAEVHMGNDRDLFTDFEPGLPVYEGRMIDQYDHRAKAYRSGRGRAAVWEPLPFGGSGKAIVSQWRVPLRNLPEKVRERVGRYRVAFCDVASPGNERTLVAALVPPGVVCGHKAPTLTLGDDDDWAYLPWLVAANSFCVDFLARKKVTLSMALNVVDSLPLPRLLPGDTHLDRLAPLALRLTCTAPDMVSYWNAMSVYGWCELVEEGSVPADALLDESARAEARAEIDAVVAKRLYGLSRDQLAYVLDQFPVLERKDRKAFGTFATKDRVLEWFDRV
jgi:hypothetical protein